MKFAAKTFAAVLLASTCMPAGAWAAEAEATASDMGTEVRGVVVTARSDRGYRARRTSTATRTDTPLIEVPQSVSVVTREELSDRAVTSMQEATAYTPGLSYSQGEGNRDTPVFRGNTTTSAFFVDGVRDDVQYYRDLYNIDRVEVLRGPNAMIFGRGGVGGVINRVTRQADFRDVREVRLEAGGYDHFRGTFDVGAAIDDATAARLTGLYQNSGSYRDGVEYERYGVNPTLTWRATPQLLVTLGYEFFHDGRTADRGVPSLNGRPIPTDPSTFFGDSSQSYTYANVDALSGAVEYAFSEDLNLRSRLHYAAYDRFYQNVYPGTVLAEGARVAITAYNNGIDRQNLISQTDLNYRFAIGSIRHTLLAGVELGRQDSDNQRLTGSFQGVPAAFVCPTPSATQICVPVATPNNRLPVLFAPSATDASNRGAVRFGALYLQDQIALNDSFQIIAGLRFDAFDVDFRNRRTDQRIQTADRELSPRIGLIYQPAQGLSLYASYTRSFLPRSGDQLSSLTVTSATLQPEQFDNYEVGAKWDPTDRLSLTGALYRLDRSNVIVPDPNDAARSLLVDGQRTTGVELSVAGRLSDQLSVVGAYTWQKAEITRAQSATIRAGNRLANTPETMASLWARYDVTPRWGGALGVIYQGSRYAATDNAVVLAGYTRLDGALYVNLSEQAALQLNVENLTDARYFANADNNNNLTPGSPRAARVGVTLRY